MGKKRLIFQLGTNNWQRGGEFAPGSGVLHEAHHKAFNALPDTQAYSVYPSRKQRYQASDVKIFELDHDIPICESISPVSSYRWHGMSSQEVSDYRQRLTDVVHSWMEEIEDKAQDYFSLAIAHHTFLNPLVLRDVIAMRVAAGKPWMPLLCFVHGTALKMYANERRGDKPDEYPLRFLPMIEDEMIFANTDERATSQDDSQLGVDLFAAISGEQVGALRGLFPSIPEDRVVLSPNGYNQDVFQIIGASENIYANRSSVLKEFQTVPYDGSPRAPESIDGDVDAVVMFCGKFADWKRLEALLQAAAIYENGPQSIATLIVGTGPHEDQKRLQTLAHDQLNLQRAYFLGPRAQDELAVLFNAADVGCFPSHKEPFGLVFIECMACGTPVIGANSGGPRDFVTGDVGELVAESDDLANLSTSLAETITRAIREDWKSRKGQNAARFAAANFSVANQVEQLLAEVDRRYGS